MMWHEWVLEQLEEHGDGVCVLNEATVKVYAFKSKSDLLGVNYTTTVKDVPVFCDCTGHRMTDSCWHVRRYGKPE